MTPRPLSPYAASKCAGELLLRTYAACYGLCGVSLRYFNVFGPRQRPDSPYAAVIPRFAQKPHSSGLRSSSPNTSNHSSFFGSYDSAAT